MIKLGIVGGGQLGRMLTLEAKKMGYTVYVTDPTPESPAGQVADKQIIGGYKDEKTTRELAAMSDVVTIDAEFVNDEVLEDLQKKGTPVHPSPRTIRIIKDKLNQKKFLKKHKIPVADFLEVSSEEEIVDAGKKFGYPFLLKARTDAYDGRGNALIRSKKDIPLGIEKLKGRPLYVERFVPFVKELAIQVARNTKGEIKTYPVVETMHKNNICHIVIAPAPILTTQNKKAQLLGKKVMQALKGAGVFGIEMFLTKDGKVLVNEIAPRVHNSGHYTIEGVATSQFEQHVRAVSGLPLGDTTMVMPVSVMINILGERNGAVEVKGLGRALSLKNVSVHIYGKKDTKMERKMGHITALGDTVSETLARAKKARKYIQI